MRNILSTRRVDGSTIATVALLFAVSSLVACSSDTDPEDGSSTTDKPDVVIEAGDIDQPDTEGVDTAVKDEDAGSDNPDIPGAECTPNTAAEDCKDKVSADPDLCEAIACEAGKCVKGKAEVDAICKSTSECYAVTKCTAEGKCEGPLTCTPDAKEGDPQCIEAFCNDKSKCQYKNLDGDCDDNNACTDKDACKFKVCNGVPIDIAQVCDDDKNCTQDTCDAATGCVNKAEPMDDKPCSNDDLCTGDNICAKGVCGGGTKVVCDDKNPCTKDTCDPKAGCVFKALANGATCDDGSKCTDPDKCDEGKCIGELIPNAKPTSACEQLACDPLTGKVTAKAAPDGLQCDDGKPCTIGDQCLTGSCKGKVLVCNQGDPCADDFCDEKTGSCAQKPKEDGVACDDGNECTTKNACKGGTCIGVQWKDSDQCDDKNACTSDGCSPKSGCFHVPANDKFCDDGNACTELDKCFGGKCAGQAKGCDDNKPCTKDACDPNNGNCTNISFVGPCDDGKKCTQNTLCLDGKCEGEAVKCDDDNPCTTDFCDSLIGCKYVAKAGGAPCSDGVSCTHNDKCDGGKCKGDDMCLECVTDVQCVGLNDGNLCTGQWRCVEVSKGLKACELDQDTVVKCPATEDECSGYACDPKTAKCSLSTKDEGTPCLSADKCVVADSKTCSKDGKCVGDQADCNDDEPCTVDACDKAKGCTHQPKEDKTACDDGSVCTPSTACTAGKCTGVNNCECTDDSKCAQYEDGDLCNGLWKCLADSTGKKFCSVAPKSQVKCSAPDGEPCKQGLCEKATGKCSVTAVQNGNKCDDGDACTILEACLEGKCESGGKVNCGDDNSCTIDVCDKVFGCGNAPINEGGICDDGSLCTEKDKCTKGVCAGVKVVCDDGNQCTVGLCNQAKGDCTVILSDGAKCSDDNPCTTDDVCKDGKCAGPPMDCDDKDSCTIDACDGVAGCKNVLVPGKDCSDGDACTISDSCGADGKCLGKPTNCGDGNDCTKDQCVNGACVITAEVGKECSDSNKCTENDKCDAQGACKSQPVDCTDDNPCTAVVGACSPQNGCNVVQSDGKFCDDGDKCTINGKCQGGSCQGIKQDCDDKNPCTDDSCAPDKGCVNKQNVCDDDNDCTSATCDQVKGCIFSPIDGFQPCLDDNACTKDGVCNKDKCEGKLVLCDDDNVCTKDSCDPKAVLGDDKKDGCVFMPEENTATKCEDGDACTIGFCDGQGKCGATPVDCDDGNPCTKDSCDKLKGCVTSDLGEKSVCDDGDECTKDTVCQGGFCSGGVVTCPLCPKGTDEECAIFDDNDLCNGTFECILNDPNKPALGGKCLEDKNSVVCDTLDDGPCLKNRCSPLTGNCAKTELVNGSTCEDGVACTIKDTCNNGLCVSGVLADCSSVGDSCNEAICLPDVSAKDGYTCVGLPKTGTVLCDSDDNGCTAHDACDNGKCKPGKEIDCQGVQGECEVVACVSKGGGDFNCQVSQAPNFSPCDDGQLCTSGDFCNAAGKCTAGLKTFDCSGNDECADYACDAKGNGGTGACNPTPKNEGGPCDSDGSGCTVKDICVLGHCIPGAAPDCAAKSGACTIGACKPQGATNYTCVAAPRNESKPCEADDNGCTVGDHCAEGQCVAGKMKDCTKFDSNGGCLVGTCVKLSSSQGECKGVPAAVNKPCNADDSGCTQDDKCNADGACINGQPVDCLAFAGVCYSGNCKPDPQDPNKFTCTGDQKPDGTACNADGDGCTVDDKCAKGKCVQGAAADCSKEAQGTCVLGGCESKGVEGYTCKPVQKKDGEICDADDDGCTVGDTCGGGACVKGKLETCEQFGGSCATAACKSTSPFHLTCQQTIKESYPNLDPAQPCKPKAAPECPPNYKCTVTNAGLDEGTCKPTVQIVCADGDACSENDVCSNGKCVSGTGVKNCDDKSACTLDYCLGGLCRNDVVPGCGACLDEDWDYAVDPAGGVSLVNLIDGTWAITSDEPMADPKAVKPKSAYRYGAWKFTSNKTYKGSLRAMQAQWEKDYSGADPNGSPKVRSRLMYRRLYVHEGPLTLTFRLHMAVKGQDCGTDNLSVYINNREVWKRCSDSKLADLEDGFEFITVYLNEYAGAPADLEFRVTADSSLAGFGAVTIDDVALVGACGPGCLGTSFEDPAMAGDEPGATAAPRIPGVWQVEASNSDYLSWKVDPKVGHSGVSSLRAAWQKAPPGGQAQTAKLTIPGVTPGIGDALNLALRTTELGTGSCGDDQVTVTIDGQLLLKQCTSASGWTVHSYGLSQWATKTVDIVIEARSGTGVNSKGLVEIDDIAIRGSCKYLCMHEEFDSNDLNSWSAASTEQVALKWGLATDLYKTKPNAAYANHGAAAKDGGSAVLLGKVADGLQFQVPVAGAEFSFDANVALAANMCSVDPKVPDPRVVGLSLQVPESPILGNATGEAWMLGGFCAHSSGWKAVGGVVPVGANGHRVLPALTIRKVQNNAATKAYFDSVKMICK